MTTPMQNDGYVSLPITIDPNKLLQAAIAAIRLQIPGWAPHEGQLDVAILEEAAQMMAVAAAAATTVPETIFSYFGQLIGITPNRGAQASAPATIVMATTAGYTIPAGTVVSYPLSGNSALLFTVKTTVVIPSGTDTGTCTLVCEVPGSFPNGLPAASCQMVTTFAEVSSIATTAPVSGGAAPETSASYLNRLSNELQLLAPRPILPKDFAAMASNVPGVYRALAINGLSKGRTVTAAVSATSTRVTSSGGDFSTTDIGRMVSGTGIPSGTVVQSVSSSTAITLSKSASASTSAVTLTLGDLRTVERYVTVCGLTSTGTSLPTAVTTAMKAYLDAKREVNFVVATTRPTVTAIDVTANVYVAPGVTATAVQSAVGTAITKFLDPATWGGGNAQVPLWSATATAVRFLDLAYAIHAVAGVLYIPATGLTLALHGGTQAAADVTLPGDAPLPKVGTVLVRCLG